MRIGYPCVNASIGCSAGRTFRLSSLSDALFIAKVQENITCLSRIVEWNAARGILFFRIGSGLIPFASHPVMRFPWQKRFAADLYDVGSLIRKCGVRNSTHPDQFVLLNSPKPHVVEASVRELVYHAELLDLMELGCEAKIQIHVGGVYGDKTAGVRRFCETFGRLPASVRRRLVVENDERLYCLADALAISEETGAPVLLDFFHHSLNNRGEPVDRALAAASATWTAADGVPMTDFSTQKPSGRFGAHALTLDRCAWKNLLAQTRDHDFDVMLEIKDKEQSALEAIRLAAGDPRLQAGGAAP